MTTDDDWSMPAPWPEPLRCATCAEPLAGDPDDDPDGDAGLPICGECARIRHAMTLDLLDGDLDGRID